VLGGAMVVAVLLAVVAWLALDDPRARVSGSEHEAVAVSQEPEPERGPEDLDLELYDGEDFSVLRPASWEEERMDEEDSEAYDVRFDDPHGPDSFQLSYVYTRSGEEGRPDALQVLESVEENRAEELADYEQVRLEELDPEGMAGVVQAAQAESTYRMDELQRLVRGIDDAERFRLQVVVSDGTRLHSLFLVGPAERREAYADPIEEIFASFTIGAEGEGPGDLDGI
jgi:hypothetical protein